MNKLNTDSWRLFKLSDIFEVKKTKNYTSEIATEWMGNDIPYITRTEQNNGSQFFVDLSLVDDLEKGNCITIGGEGASIFYQPYDFITGNNITKIYNKNLNEDNAMFIVTILKLEKYRYSYNRAFNKYNVENSLIKLPVDNFGQPDWIFMSRYIKGLKEREREISEIAEPSKLNHYYLNTKQWKYFKISQVFEIPKIKKFSSIPIYDGDVPFISSSSVNNGVVKYVDVYSVEGNVITISTNGSSFDAFYHSERIAVSTDVEVLKNDKLNKYTALFICCILKIEKYRFSYGRKAKNKLVNNCKIKLPTNSDKEPDWIYMENYIKSLPYSKYL